MSHGWTSNVEEQTQNKKQKQETTQLAVELAVGGRRNLICSTLLFSRTNINYTTTTHLLSAEPTTSKKNKTPDDHINKIILFNG